MSCLLRIENYRDSSTASERRIADFMVLNPEAVVKMTIHELAMEVDVSSSSISRFAHKLGYKSFNEMRIDLVRSVDSNIVNDFNEMLGWTDNMEQMGQKFLSTIEGVCRDVLSLNQLQKFEQVAAWVHQAEVVYLFGVGASRLVAEDLQQKLMKLGKRCIFNTDSNFGVQNAVLTGPRDLVAAVSYGGRTKEVNLAVSRAKQNGTRIVSITRYASSSLASQSDACLYVPNAEQAARLASIFSRYAMMFAVDILFVNLAKIIEKRPQQLLTEYRALLDMLKE